MIITVILVLLLIFLAYAYFYSTRHGKKKPVTTPTPPPKPQGTMIESPKVTKPVAPEVVPQTPVIVTPKVEPVQPTPVPQTPVIVTPKAEIVQPAVTEGEVKVKQTESQALKVSKEPAPKTDRGSKIIDIEGIGPTYAPKLNSIGIYTTINLLKAGETPLMRKELAEKTDISSRLILRWVNMADLFRIKGVGEEYSDLLEAAGVDTVVELSKRVPEHLHARMLEVNVEKKLVRRPPALSMVESWVKEAKTLPRKIEY